MLFYGGIVGMGLALIASVIAILMLRKSGVRLKRQLDAEYGARDKTQ